MTDIGDLHGFAINVSHFLATRKVVGRDFKSSWGYWVTVRSKLFASGLAIVLLGVIAAGCTTLGALRTTPFEIPSDRFAAIMVDEATGEVLYELRADAIRYPASLTKMMTIYMVFEALENGSLNKDSRITFSRRASNQPASKLWIKPGDSLSVDEALTALAVKSANDVAYAVAEHLGGSEAAFAAMMTSRARSLSMAFQPHSR